eukprot:COSAG01_NODE_3614_length_5866_cov_4.599619_2_plen_1512_part_00
MPAVLHHCCCLPTPGYLDARRRAKLTRSVVNSAKKTCVIVGVAQLHVSNPETGDRVTRWSPARCTHPGKSMMAVMRIAKQIGTTPTTPLGTLAVLCLLVATATEPATRGCTDPAARNYTPASRSDDGMCTYHRDHLLEALRLPKNSTCYLYAGQWPDRMPSQPGPIRNGIWVVQGKPGEGDLPCVPPSANLTTHFTLEQDSWLFLRYVRMQSVQGVTIYNGGIINAKASAVDIWGVWLGTAIRAQTGGGVYAENSKINITRTLFDGTTADSIGGGIYVNQGDGLTVVDSIFRNTRARGHLPGVGLSGGGAIWASEVPVIISGVSFTDCKAANRIDATGIAYYGDSLLCTSCSAILIKGTYFHPFNKDRTVQYDSSWLATVGGCNEHKCPQGQTCSYTNYSLFCTPCPNGTFSTNGLSCAPCKPGFGPNAARSGCEQCRSGKYSNFGECIQCEFPRRIVTTKDGLSTECLQCDNGKQPDTKQTTCVPCPAGKVTKKSGAECTECAKAGTYANKTTLTCLPCAPGKQPDADAASCVRCQGSNYSQDGGQCLPCAPPYVVKEQGAKCGPCAAGQGPVCAEAAWVAGATCAEALHCSQCIGNTYSNPEHTSGRCDPCKDGTHTNLQKSACPECSHELAHSAWSNRTGNCECATEGGVNNVGYYDTRKAIIVCFHDGYHKDVVHEVIDSFSIGDGQFEQCQRCPECTDCSMEGAPRVRSGYTLGEAHVLYRGNTVGVPTKQRFTHESGVHGDRYFHFVFFCDADTAVTPADIVERGYFTTQEAIDRCNATELILPVVAEDVDAVVKLGSSAVTASATCSLGYAGVFCESCMDSYHKQQSNGTCLPCSNSVSTPYRWWLVVLGIILAAIVMVLILCSTSCVKTALRDPNTLGGAAMGGRAGRQQAFDDIMQRQLSSQRSICCGCVTEERWRRVRLLVMSLFPSVKTLITYYMVTGQLGSVLHVRYPIIFSSATSYLHNFVVVDVWSFFSVDCNLHWGSFQNAWILHIVAKPVLLLLLPVIKFVYDWYKERSLKKDMEHWRASLAGLDGGERKQLVEKLDEAQELVEHLHGTASQGLVQNIIRVIFLCYPSVCNMAFSTLHCRPAERDVTVLVYDDRVDCPSSWWIGHHETSEAAYNLNNSLGVGFIWASFFVILVVGFGIPMVLYVKVSTVASGKCCCLSNQPFDLNSSMFEEASRELENVHNQLNQHNNYKLATSGSVQDQVIEAYIETTRLHRYTSFTDAYCPYRRGTRRCLRLPWTNSTWESVDMLRKILLVGVVVLAGRGSVAQLLFSITLSFMFFSFHVKMWPMKTDADNYLRASCEFHVFITILVGFAMKSDLSHEPLQLVFYDWLLLVTMVLSVLLGTILTIYRKWRRISKCMEVERCLEEQPLPTSPLPNAAKLESTLQQFYGDAECVTIALKRRAVKAGMDADTIDSEERESLIQAIQKANHRKLCCSFLRYCAAVSTMSDHVILQKYFQAKERGAELPSITRSLELLGRAAQQGVSTPLLDHVGGSE